LELFGRTPEEDVKNIAERAKLLEQVESMLKRLDQLKKEGKEKAIVPPEKDEKEEDEEE